MKPFSYPPHLRHDKAKRWTPNTTVTLELKCSKCKKTKQITMEIFKGSGTDFGGLKYQCIDCTGDKHLEFESPHAEWIFWNEVRQRRILRLKNPEEYNRRYKKPADPNAWRKAYAKRKIRKQKAIGNFEFDKWVQKVNYYGWLCVYCGKLLNLKTLTQDHYIPLSKKGTNFIANLVPACRRCNSRKNKNGWWTIKYRPSTRYAQTFLSL